MIFFILELVFRLLQAFYKKNIEPLTNDWQMSGKHVINILFFHVCKSLTVARYIYCFKLDHTSLRHLRQKNTNPLTNNNKRLTNKK